VSGLRENERIVGGTLPGHRELKDSALVRQAKTEQLGDQTGQVVSPEVAAMPADRTGVGLGTTAGATSRHLAAWAPSIARLG